MSDFSKFGLTFKCLKREFELVINEVFLSLAYPHSINLKLMTEAGIQGREDDVFSHAKNNAPQRSHYLLHSHIQCPMLSVILLVSDNFQCT